MGKSMSDKLRARPNRKVAMAVTGMALTTLLVLAMLVAANCLVRTVRADPSGIKYTGVASCSQCHGDDYDKTKPEDKKSKEVEIWKSMDPHSKTFEQLTSEMGQSIAAKMKIADAKTNQSCVSCHALSGMSTMGRVVRVNLDPQMIHNDNQIGDGVSCGACHGPSGNDKKRGYLIPHKGVGWTEKQRQAGGAIKLFDDFGMYDTKDMKLRANLCYSCHMIVDPDLIAAAHPHRPFESNVLYTRYRKLAHFAGDKDEFSESKLWAVGQIISLREAADDMSELGAKKKGDVALQAAYEHLLAHALTFRQIVPAAAQAIDTAIATIQANRTQPEKMAEPLKAIARTANQEVDKLNAIKFTRETSEKLLKAVASESAQSAQAGLSAATQYLFALTSLWGNLKDPQSDTDEKFTKIKALAKVLKPANNQSANYTTEMKNAYVTETSAVAALFPGGQPIPLPPSAFVFPEIKGQAAAAPELTKTEPVTKEPVKAEPAKPPVPESAELKSAPPAPLQPRKVYEDYSKRAPLVPAEYGTCVFCLECGMQWPLGRNYCGRCGRALPVWEEKSDK